MLRRGASWRSIRSRHARRAPALAHHHVDLGGVAATTHRRLPPSSAADQQISLFRILRASIAEARTRRHGLDSAAARLRGPIARAQLATTTVRCAGAARTASSRAGPPRARRHRAQSSPIALFGISISARTSALHIGAPVQRTPEMPVGKPGSSRVCASRRLAAVRRQSSRPHAGLPTRRTHVGGPTCRCGGRRQSRRPVRRGRSCPTHADAASRARLRSGLSSPIRRGSHDDQLGAAVLAEHRSRVGHVAGIDQWC